MPKFWNNLKSKSRSAWNASNSDTSKKVWNKGLSLWDKLQQSDLGQKATDGLDEFTGGFATKIGKEVRGFGDDVVNRDNDVKFQDFMAEQIGKRSRGNMSKADAETMFKIFNKVAPTLDKGVGKFEDKIRSELAKEDSGLNKLKGMKTKDIKQPRGVRRR